MGGLQGGEWGQLKPASEWGPSRGQVQVISAKGECDPRVAKSLPPAPQNIRNTNLYVNLPHF